MNRSKLVSEGAVFTAVYIAILLLSFIPVISAIAIFLMPLPFIVFTSRHGWKPALLMTLASFLIAFIFTNLAAIPFTLLAALGGIVIGNAIYKKRSAYETCAQGTAAIAVALVLILLIIQSVFDINVSVIINELMGNAFQLCDIMID